MRALAKACDINVAALYHYFDSKEQLLAAVIQERNYDAQLAEVPDIDPNAEPVDRMVHLFLAFWDGAQEEEDVWRLLLMEGFRSHPTALTVGAELLAVLHPALADWIQEVFPELNGAASTAADLVITSMFGLFIESRFMSEVDSRELAATRGRQLGAALFP